MNDTMSWIQEYLRGEGNNVPLADGLLLEERKFYGPVEYTVNKLSRCCGPEETMTYRTPQEDFDRRIAGIIARLSTGWYMPPLLVNYSKGTLTVTDGNHRLEAYRRLDKPTIPVIFWVTGEPDYHACVSLVGATRKEGVHVGT
jgi:hypothetical protein